MQFLETERLVLRNVEAADAEVMYDYRNNELCARFQRGQTKDLGGIKELIEKRKNDKLTVGGNSLLAIALKESGEMIGEIVVMPNDGAITLGYTISYRHHRKGYAYEALHALTEKLHADYPDRDFICFTERENVASMELLKKLGYEYMGYAPKITSEVFGKWVKPDAAEEIAKETQKQN